MNARQKKMAATAAIFAIAIPAVGFAATNTATGTAAVEKAAKTFRMGSGSQMGQGYGMKGGMMGGQAGMMTNESVRTALAASGVILPTADEAKAYHEKMKTAREAEQALPDADKATLKAMRDAAFEKAKVIYAEAAKAEREYLRSKGVALPSETEIAKMSETMKKAAEVLRAQNPNMSQERGKGRKGGHDQSRGMRGGMQGDKGFGPMRGNQDAPTEAGAAK